MTQTRGEKIRQERTVGAFDAIEMHGIGKLVVRQSGDHSVAVLGSSAVVERVITRVANGTLVIRLRPRIRFLCFGAIRRDAAPEIHVTAPEVERIGLHGACALVAETLAAAAMEIATSGASHAAIEGIEAERFRLRTSGAAKIDVARIEAERAILGLSGSGRLRVGQVIGESVDLALSGTAVAEAAGQSERVRVVVSGAGKVHADGLRSREASVKVSGSGKVSVWASEALDVHVSGAGKVRYGGNPRVSQKISGSAAVEAIG